MSIELKHSPRYYADKYSKALMRMAFVTATLSKAERKKVGAVIYLNDHTISMGFNGQPSGHETEVCEEPCTVNTSKTCASVIHAEDNAISKVLDKTLLNDAVLFVTMAPCLSCATKVVAAGIGKVYFNEVYRSTEGIDYLDKHNVIINNLSLDD